MKAPYLGKGHPSPAFRTLKMFHDRAGALLRKKNNIFWARKEPRCFHYRVVSM